ncbi:MAG: ribonuclease P protein component [Gammaproteobacteria bacterium]
MTCRAEFDRVFGSGQRIRTRHFTLIAVRTGGAPRLGIAVGRRYATRAVARNRMKRLIREVFRHAEPAPFDIVVTVRPDASRVQNRELAAELARSLGELK